MSSLAVAVTTWAVSTTTGLALSPPSPDLSPVADPVAAVADKGLTLGDDYGQSMGFSMEGPPQVEVVFGDVSRYRLHIDSFHGILADMTRARRRFSRHTKSAIAIAGGLPRRKCDHTVLGPHYYYAHRYGETFRAQGAALERDYAAVIRHDKHGDSDGLSPAYRAKVKKVRSLYRQALIDYKEMRVAFMDQLRAESIAHRCSVRRLLAEGKKSAEPAIDQIAAPTQKVRPPRAPPIDAKPFRTATFFIDNRKCDNELAVVVDGKPFGVVGKRRRRAFQTETGRHSMCLLPEGGAARCGDTGTVRNAYIHDGWAIAMHCAGK